MRYGFIAATAAAAISIAAGSAGAQSTGRTAAQNAWCAVHIAACQPQRDVRHDRSAVVRDLEKVQRQRRQVRADARDLRTDRSMYSPYPAPAARRDMYGDRVMMARTQQRIAAEQRDIRRDSRDIRADREDRDRDRR